MKKRSIVYLLLFVFAFVLPSFSFPDEKGSDEKTVRITSDTVHIEFNNPKLIVTQQNFEKTLETYLLNNKELLDVAKDFNETFTKYVSLQENECKLSLDLLSQQTGYSIGQINKFIHQKNALSVVNSIILVIFSLALFVIYQTSYRRLRENVTGLLVTSISLFALLLIALNLLWPSLMGENYVIFYKLLELTPF